MRYEVVVVVPMSASVYVEAADEDEAYDIVHNDIYSVDYCNETCGFDFNDNAIEAVENTSTSLEGFEICCINEA